LLLVHFAHDFFRYDCSRPGIALLVLLVYIHDDPGRSNSSLGAASDVSGISW
jgi:hypothetical protein